MKINKKTQNIITTVLNVVLGITVATLLGIGIWRGYKSIDFFVDVKKPDTKNEPTNTNNENDGADISPTPSETLPNPSVNLPE